MKSREATKPENKKNLRGLLLALLLGFALAMAAMAVAIYFGYTDAYRLGTDSHTVSLFGLRIYELTKGKDAYTGAAVGTNMGIFCIVCMLLTTAAEQLLTRWGHKER